VPVFLTVPKTFSQPDFSITLSVGMRAGNYVTPSIFPVATPPHPIKFALDLANGALMYASRLMKRLSTRSAHASLLKGIAN